MIKTLFTPIIALILTFSFIFAGCSTAPQATLTQNTATQAALDTPSAATTATQAASMGADEITYVSIDVNPSIRLTLVNGLVLEAKAYNDDGEEIVLTYDVAGLTPDAALGVLIGAFAQESYITQEDTGASLVITVCGGDEENIVHDLEESAKQHLDELGLSCEVVASDVSEEIAQEAKACGLTPGRYLLIRYLAGQDNISIEEAKVEYGSLKMGDLLKRINDIAGVFTAGLTAITQSLTPEQLQILTQAQNAFETQMKAAQQAMVQAKSEAQRYFQAAKSEAQAAFKQNKDHDLWEQTKTALQAECEQKRQEALQVCNIAKEQAKEAFMAAVAGLGLDEQTLAAMLAWDFDFSWDFDFDWQSPSDTQDPDENTEDGTQDSETSHPAHTNNGNHGGGNRTE